MPLQITQIRPSTFPRRSTSVFSIPLQFPPPPFHLIRPVSLQDVCCGLRRIPIYLVCLSADELATNCRSLKSMPVVRIFPSQDPQHANAFSEFCESQSHRHCYQIQHVHHANLTPIRPSYSRLQPTYFRYIHDSPVWSTWDGCTPPVSCPSADT